VFKQQNRMPALFLDRDGTLVHPRHYPSHPRDLVLFEGVTPGLLRLQTAGFRLVVITNQAGIARGLFTVEDLEAMHAHLRRELRQEGVEIDAIYFCPHHVDGVIPELSVACTCRKPQPGMLLRAAAELNVDLAASWFLGDILDDVQAGNRAGVRTVLVDLGTESVPSIPERTPSYVARDTAHALEIVCAAEGLASATDLGYRPASWGRDEANVSEEQHGRG
jgi:D-glycero-D-manno-heptose 1,7-bisphosphate phosphatase